jgi:hypothetical protein
MSKFISTFVIAVAAFSMIISGTLSNGIKVQASGFGVSTTSAVNVRDSKCNKIGSMPAGSIAVPEIDAEFQIVVSCTINGKKYSYRGLTFMKGSELNGIRGWVAEEFLTATQLANPSNGSSTSGNYVTGKAKTTTTLNIRDNNCKKIGSVKAGVTLTTVNNVQGGMTCTVNGTIYTMRSILSNGTVYNVAQKFITE